MSLAIFDVDGTLTSDHVWKGLMAACRHFNRKSWAHRAYLFSHYPLYFARKLRLISEMFFRERWAADLGWYLRGQTLAEVEEIGDWVAQTYLRPTWRETVIARLREHLQNGATVVLLSAAPQPLVAAIARHLGAHAGIGSAFEVRAGRYTGRPLRPLCLGDGKRIRLEAWLRENAIPAPLAEAWAYADSITDLDILESAGHPVAVFPDEALRTLAQERGWEILA
jgi:HAD superfamily hydrolase (TIGR01490 family)